MAQSQPPAQRPFLAKSNYVAQEAFKKFPSGGPFGSDAKVGFTWALFRTPPTSDEYYSPASVIERATVPTNTAGNVAERLKYACMMIDSGDYFPIGLGSELRPYLASYSQDERIGFMTAGFWRAVCTWSVKVEDKAIIYIKYRHVRPDGEQALGHSAKGLEATGFQGEEPSSSISNDDRTNDFSAPGAGRTCGFVLGCGQDGQPIAGLRIYRSEFLESSPLTTAQLSKPYPALEPNTVRLTFRLSANTQENVDAFLNFKKGTVCSDTCRWLTRREHHDKIVCDGCKKETTSKPPKIPRSLLEPLLSIPDDSNYELPQDHVTYDSKIVQQRKPQKSDLFVIYQFLLFKEGNIENTIVLLRPLKVVHEEQTGPTGRPERLQAIKNGEMDEKFDLQRRPIGSGRDTISGHFTEHVGLSYCTSYRFPDTLKPFGKWATEICDYVRTVLREEINFEAKEFNQCGHCLYWPGMKMAAHDDGQPGLEEDVVSYTLGAPQDMEWAIKKEFDIGHSGGKERKLTPNNPFVPGCQKREECLELSVRKKSENMSDEDYNPALWEIVKDNKHSDRHESEKGVLKLRVQEGDILLQHGAGTQKNYRHKILPLKDGGLVRDSDTFRSIRPKVEEAEESNKRKTPPVEDDSGTSKKKRRGRTQKAGKDGSAHTEHEA